MREEIFCDHASYTNRSSAPRRCPGPFAPPSLAALVLGVVVGLSVLVLDWYVSQQLAQQLVDAIAQQRLGAERGGLDGTAVKVLARG